MNIQASYKNAFKIKKELSHNGTLRFKVADSREFAKSIKHELKYRVSTQLSVLPADDLSATSTKTPVGIEVYLSIALPFVLGFILSV